MATFTKTILSGSTNGKPIAVSASATAGTVIHTAQSGTAGLDEIWLYAVNTSSSSVKLTVEFGGTTTAENIELTITGESGLVLIIPGLTLNNSLVVRAFAGTANVISVSGYVNRIS
jgi:uncharacterized membrane protein YjjP (DUF1212 family)